MTDTLTKTAAANGPINDTRKAELLSKQVKHIDIKSFDARPIVDAMSDMSFTSRDLGRATKIYNEMLADKECTVVLVIAGSTSAGGCMDLYAELVRSNMVDVIVATGATIVDMDFFEGLGHKHFQALEIPDDDTLRSLYIDRIYDTYIDEEALQNVDHTIFEIAELLEPKAYSSRAFIREMGKYLVEHGKKDNSLVKLAYEHDVPIFCPAFVDLSAGSASSSIRSTALRPANPPAARCDRRLPRAHADQDRGGHHRPSHDRRRRAEELHPGHRRLRRDPRPRGRRGPQICGADHRRRRPRRRLLVLDAAGGGELGKVNTGIQQMVFAEAGSVMPLLASDAYHRGHWKDRAVRGWAKLFSDIAAVLPDLIRHPERRAMSPPALDAGSGPA
ncbi:deoxyhypusine synthase family protein [Sphingomonas sp. MMS24-JH45]